MNWFKKYSHRIVDIFITMKNYINTSLIEQKYINSLVLEHDNEIRFNVFLNRRTKKSLSIH